MNAPNPAPHPAAPAAPPSMRAEDYSHLSQRGQALVARLRTRIAELAEDARPASVLEVGCGQGWLLARLADALPDARLAGMDIREDAVAYARSLVPRADLRVADGARLPYGDGEFDLVICSEVLEHVDEPAAVLAEIRRVGGGSSVMSVPWEPYFWGANLVRGKYARTLGNCPGHIHHFTGGGFRRMLAGTFPHVEVYGSFPWLVARVRWE